MADSKDKKGKEEKGVVGTTADVTKGAAKGAVSGTKKVGGAIVGGVKKVGKNDK